MAIRDSIPFVRAPGYADDESEPTDGGADDAGGDFDDDLPTTGFVYYDKDDNVVEPEPFTFDDDWYEDDGKEAR